MYEITGVLTFTCAGKDVFSFVQDVDGEGSAASPLPDSVAPSSEPAEPAERRRRTGGSDGGVAAAELTAAGREVLAAVAAVSRVPVSRASFESIEELVVGQARLSVVVRPFRSETLAHMAQGWLNADLSTSEQGLDLSGRYCSFHVYFGLPVEYVASVAPAPAGNGTLVDSTADSTDAIGALDLVTIIAIALAVVVALVILIVACCICRSPAGAGHEPPLNYSSGGDGGTPFPQFGSPSASPTTAGYMDPFDVNSSNMSGVSALAHGGKPSAHFYPGGTNWGSPPPAAPDEGYLVFHEKRSSISRRALDDAIMKGSPVAARADIHKVHSEVQNAVTGEAIGRSRSVKHASDWLRATDEQADANQRRWSSRGTAADPFGQGQTALVTALTDFEADALADDIARLEKQQELEQEFRRKGSVGNRQAVLTAEPGRAAAEQPSSGGRAGSDTDSESWLPDMMSIFVPANEEDDTFVLDQTKLAAFISSGLLDRLPSLVRQQVEGTVLKFPNRAFSEDEVLQLLPTLEAVASAAET